MINKEEIEKAKVRLIALKNFKKTYCGSMWFNITTQLDDEGKKTIDTILQYISELEYEKTNQYWQGYIQKQNEAMDICKVCPKVNRLEKENKRLEEINKEHQKINGELQKKLTKLEKEKHIWDLTKIACCNAQNCEALNNAIREGLENEKLREENSKLKEIIEGKAIQEMGISDLYKED